VRGSAPTETFFYATLPTTAPRLVSLTLYRWEVITRETVVAIDALSAANSAEPATQVPDPRVAGSVL
jgi:hypothetical protein